MKISESAISFLDKILSKFEQPVILIYDHEIIGG